MERMRKSWARVMHATLLAAMGGILPQPAAAEPQSGSVVRQLDTTARPWTGDFDAMLERRIIRAVVPYSRSLYFSDRGRQTGISADFVRGFEKWLNKKYEKQLGNRPLTLLIIPTTRDKLLPGVVDGTADVAVGNITITDERRKNVEFVTMATMSGGRSARAAPGSRRRSART